MGKGQAKRRFGRLRKLPSGRWQARYSDPSGKLVSAPQTFATKTDADRWLAMVEADLHRGEWRDPKLGRVAFSEWAEQWYAGTATLKPKTRVWYESSLRNHVLPHFGALPVAGIDQVGVKSFLAELTAAGKSQATVRGAFAVTRLVLGSALSSGAIRSNPCSGVRQPRPSRHEMCFLSPDEIAILAETISNPPIKRGGGEHRRQSYPEYGLLVTFAAYTGLRAGEIEALRVKNLDLLRGTVHVCESLAQVHGELVLGPTKTYESRTVPLPRFLVDDLAAHLSAHPHGADDLVFTAPLGGPIRHELFYRNFFKPAVARSGVPQGLRFHDLRHTYAALLISQGAHPRAMMERLGHSSVTVTIDTYGHLMPGLEEKLTDGLDAIHAEAASSRRGTQGARAGHGEESVVPMRLKHTP